VISIASRWPTGLVIVLLMSTRLTPHASGAKPCAYGLGMARGRSEEVDEAIVSSALAVIGDCGIEGFSVEEVASRAAVGKATIYRRYADRQQLISSALETLNDDLPAINRKSSAVDALIEMLEWVRTSRTSGAEILPRIFAQAKSNPELFQMCHARIIHPRWQRVEQALEMGIERGELRADLDIDIVCSMLVAPVITYGMLHVDSEDQPGRRDYVKRLVNHALTGIAVTPESPDSGTRRRARSARSGRRLRKALATD